MILFYDDCHKIYYADESETDTIDQFLGYGYDKIEGDFATNVRELYTGSCSLRFISPANLDDRPSVGQFAEEIDEDMYDSEIDEAMNQTVDNFLKEMECHRN